MEHIISSIQQSDRIILSTHRQSDGDGIGSQLALYFALKKVGKNVRIVNIDGAPRKYRFLSPDTYTEVFEKDPALDVTCDLFLIFDTNDERLVEPLFSKVKQTTKNISFIDHHPLLSHGPQPTKQSWIASESASTGEMTYRIIKGLGVDLDRNIARALYTSITFDTQLYRFIRNSPESHLIAAELLRYNIEPEEIHRHLIGHHTINKISFLAKALGNIEYFHHGQLAILRFSRKDMDDHRLDYDESRDIIDIIMNIESLEAAAILREDKVNEYKVSLRSKGLIEVLDLAEMMGGGGHRYAAGASVKDQYESIRNRIVSALTPKLKNIFS